MSASRYLGRLALLALGLMCGCGGGGGGGGAAVNNPPTISLQSIAPTTVDMSGQPTVVVSVNVTDENIIGVVVSAVVTRQSGGFNSSINFSRSGNNFSGNFNAPTNSGAAAEVYTITVSANDAINPVANLTLPTVTVNAPQNPGSGGGPGLPDV